MDKKDLELNMLSAYKKTFTSETGKLVLHDLIDKGGIFLSSYVDGDALAMAHRDGGRTLVLYILAKLQLKPNDISKVYEENNQHIEEYL